MGAAIVMICYTLATMLLRWSVAGEKWEPKMRNPPPPPKMTFDEAVKRYKELEYNNALNDN